MNCFKQYLYSKQGFYKGVYFELYSLWAFVQRCKMQLQSQLIHIVQSSSFEPVWEAGQLVALNINLKQGTRKQFEFRMSDLQIIYNRVSVPIHFQKVCQCVHSWLSLDTKT